MAEKKLKVEIKKLLDKVPEQTLMDVLELLQQEEKRNIERIQRVEKLRETLIKDKKFLDTLSKNK